MKPSVLTKLDTLLERFEELNGLLSDAEVIGDPQHFRELSREYAELEEVVQCYSQYRDTQQAVADAREMLSDGDAELRAMAAEELEVEQARLAELEGLLQRLLLPRDPNDRCNIFLEVRAGTHFQEDVAAVIGITGQQQALQ